MRPFYDVGSASELYFVRSKIPRAAWMLLAADGDYRKVGNGTTTRALRFVSILKKKCKLFQLCPDIFRTEPGAQITQTSFPRLERLQ
jgi:hypothetical protein